jgi:hypothetical protein
LPPLLHFPLRCSCTFRCAAATADAAATKVTAFIVIITNTAIVAHVQHMLGDDNVGAVTASCWSDNLVTNTVR